MGDDLRRYRSMIRKMRERVFAKHPEMLAVFDEQYDTERLKAQEEFPGAPDVGQYWAERRTWDWAWERIARSQVVWYLLCCQETPQRTPGLQESSAKSPRDLATRTEHRHRPQRQITKAPQLKPTRPLRSQLPARSSHQETPQRHLMRRQLPTRSHQQMPQRQLMRRQLPAKKQPSANALKAADKPSQAVRRMSLGDPEGSSRNPPTQQRRIAIPRPRLPTIEAAAAQDRLRAELAGLQRTLEQLQPLDRVEREVAAMERMTMNNPDFFARFLVELHQELAGAPPPPPPPPQVPAPPHPQHVEAFVPPKEPPSPGQAGKDDDEDMSDS